MSKSIKFVLELGGELNANTNQLAAFSCNAEESNIIANVLDESTAKNGFREWEFVDGSIVALWSAGIYAKQPWYFMAYDCEESDAIRYRRANPTPDTSHE
jgi:hypothetical protein